MLDAGPVLRLDPPIPESGRKPLDFVPKGWRYAAWLPGDFNADGQTYHVVLIARDDPTLVKVWQKSQWDKQLDGEPSPDEASWVDKLERRKPVLDGNPRILLVLVGEPGGGLRLFYRADKLLRPADLAAKMDPFRNFGAVERGFYLEFREDNPVSTTIRRYEFAYSQKTVPPQFEIVRARMNLLPRGDGPTANHVFDFVKREHLSSKGQMEFGGGAGHSFPQPPESLKDEPLVTLETFKGPGKWWDAKDSIL